MYYGEISDSVYSLGLACGHDLPDIEYNAALYNKPVSMKKRRPNPSDCEVYSFPQTWASTALGFGGIGGQAMSTAQTTVIIEGRSAAVYFSRRLAYVIVGFNEKLMADIRSFSMAACGSQGKYKQKE